MNQVIPKKKSERILSRRPGRPLGSKSKYHVSDKVLERNSKAGFISQIKNLDPNTSRSRVMNRFKENRLGLIKNLIKPENVKETEDFVKSIYVQNLKATTEPIALMMDEYAELKTKSQLLEVRDNDKGIVSKEYLEVKRLGLAMLKELNKSKYGETVTHNVLLSENKDTEVVFDVSKTQEE